MACFKLCVSPVLTQNEDIWNFHSSLTLNKGKLQSVNWSLAEFRHNKIVQLLGENCFNVSRQLQRKVRSRKHDV